jgi:nucleotide-binding universal stress UspA family protein
MWTGQIIPPDESAEMDEVEQAKHFVAHRFVKTLLNQDISFKLHIILGSTDSPTIADFIVKKAGEVGAEGIVMAKHRKGKVTELVVGSVTSEVIKRATGHCPVVVVPSQWKAVME